MAMVSVVKEREIILLLYSVYCALNKLCAVYTLYVAHEAPQVRFTNAQHHQLNQCVMHRCVSVYVRIQNKFSLY